MARKSYAGAASATTLTNSISATATSFSVVNASGYPAGSDPFVVVIGRGTTSEEKMLITSVSGQSFTVTTRGYDDTSAQSHSVGETVEHCIDAITIDEANAHVNDDSRDDHSQYLTTTRHRSTDLHTFGGAFAAPANPAPIGTLVNTGSATGPSRADHVHVIGTGAINDTAHFAAGIVQIGTAIATPAAPANVAAAAATGSATGAARADHVHALDAAVAGNGIALSSGVLAADVDGVGVEISGGLIALKDSGVTTARIADSGVTTAKIADDAVTEAKLAPGLPLGWLDGDTKGSNSDHTTDSAIASLSISLTPTSATRKIRVEFNALRLSSPDGNTSTTAIIRFYRDGTDIIRTFHAQCGVHR
jgi:hypothetical protein